MIIIILILIIVMIIAIIEIIAIAIANSNNNTVLNRCVFCNKYNTNTSLYSYLNDLLFSLLCLADNNSFSHMEKKKEKERSKAQRQDEQRKVRAGAAPKSQDA